MRPATLFCLAAALAGCARPGPPPPPPTVHTVAVLPVNNRTGDLLLVSGGSFLEKYATHTDRVTVPDVLQAYTRAELIRQGFTVVPPETVESATAGRTPGSPEAAAELARNAKLDGTPLYLEIARWAPDAGMQPTFIIVGAEAVLVDPQTGASLWRVHLSPRPVPTPGAVTLGSAYMIAARKVAEELLKSWESGPGSR
jgi:hypothetical protein